MANAARQPRVAIVSDPLVQRGGAERVVEAMAEAFPAAPIFALLYSPLTGPKRLAPRVRSSWLGSIPGAARRHRALLPWYPSAVESLDLREFDVIVSSHHTAAKGIVRSGDQLHICYCHTPMRALWERPHEEIETLPRALRPAAQLLFRRMRAWDVATAARVDHFIANSRTTQRRIAKHWMRESELLNPPIDVDRFTPGGEVSDYYLIAARPVAYKRIDVAVEAARRSGRRVIVVGGARETTRIEGVEYRGHVEEDELVALMRGARALLFPQNEDFGMTPLEVNACGRPVIAFAAGGALETVVDGTTGILVPEQTPAAFGEAIRRLETMPFSPVRIRRHAEGYSRPVFLRKIRDVVDRLVGRDLFAVPATGYEIEGPRIRRAAPG